MKPVIIRISFPPEKRDPQKHEIGGVDRDGIQRWKRLHNALLSSVINTGDNATEVVPHIACKVQNDFLTASGQASWGVSWEIQETRPRDPTERENVPPCQEFAVLNDGKPRTEGSAKKR